jgi:hypothetical protein
MSEDLNYFILGSNYKNVNIDGKINEFIKITTSKKCLDLFPKDTLIWYEVENMWIYIKSRTKIDSNFNVYISIGSKNEIGKVISENDLLTTSLNWKVRKYNIANLYSVSCFRSLKNPVSLENIMDSIESMQVVPHLEN